MTRGRVLVVVTAVLALGLGAGLAHATYPGANGPLIVFSRLAPPCPAGFCRQQIATVHPDGTGERYLTKGNVDENPTWSPDGSHVAFVRVYALKPAPQLWVVNADGSGLKQLAHGLVGIDPNSPGSVPTPDWLDNQRIAFDAHAGITCKGRLTNCIDVANRSGGPIKSYAVLPQNTISWAIHGSRVAYVKLPQGLYVVNLNGKGRRLVTHGPKLTGVEFPFDEEGGGRIDWSPDGRRILFVTPHYGQGNDNFPAELYTVGVQSHALFEIPGRPWIPATANVGVGDTIFPASWSPDGTKIVFRPDSSQSGFMIIPSSGGTDSGVWIKGSPSSKCNVGRGSPFEVCTPLNPRWQPRSHG